MGVVLSGGLAVPVSSSAYAQVRETVSLVARALEDVNWTNLAMDDRNRALEDDYYDRITLIERSRLAARRNPLAKQAIRLLQNYTLGKGYSVKAENRKMVAKVVDEFIEDPVNQAALFSQSAMKEFLAGIFTDGDYFIVLFPDKDLGTLKLGYLDPVYVVDVIPVKGNAKMPAWYKCQKPDRTFNFETGQWVTSVNSTGTFTYYRHWRNDDPKPDGMGTLEDGLIYPVHINKRGKFGVGELVVAIDWLKAHREFMEDRATLNRSAAMVGWKKTRKGPASDIAQEAIRLQSSLVTDIGRYERNPPPAAGATYVHNEGSDLEWVKTETGGSAADYDERKLRMMSGAGMGGIPNHYFGDEANANLATATAMELPLLKTYEDWQQLCTQTLSDLIEFSLTVANEAGRIGDRDDSRRYAEHVTTGPAVLAKLDSGDAMVSNGPQPGTGPAKVGETDIEEAVPTPTDAGAQISVRDPTLQVSLIPKTDTTGQAAEELDTSGAVSWYVDVDFPPILMKDLGTYFTALKGLYDILPPQNIESQKMVVEMALVALGTNGLEEEMERLFPPDMLPVDQLSALAGLQKKLAPPPMPGLPGGPPAPKQLEPGLPVKESDEDNENALSLADYRTRRIRRMTRALEDGLAVSEG